MPDQRVVDRHAVDRGAGPPRREPEEPAAASGTVCVGVLTEESPGENRVALVPEVTATLVAAGFSILVEAGAGERAWFPDDAFRDAGARVTPRKEVLNSCEVLLVVNRPEPDVLQSLRAGQVLIGLLDGQSDRAGLETLALRDVQALSLDLLPRQLPRAQTMDALTSQSSIAGYRAALLAASTYDEFFPMMITAAGTARPANVLILGTGVAGLQAIGTARRLGAQVTGYDVRPESREEVTSLGAKFLTTSIANGASEGGYARGMTDQETAAQHTELAAKVGAFNILITTAQVPGRVPPVLVTKQMLTELAPGSVVIDMAASDLGGNVEGSAPEETVVTEHGVRIIGAGSLASAMPSGASQAYARNVAAVLTEITPDLELMLDTADEVIGALWVRPEPGSEETAPEAAVLAPGGTAPGETTPGETTPGGTEADEHTTDTPQGRTDR